mgnify:CR=1 FL=1|jgi:hypothetical protein|tara:strand:- start:185 stop:406 length:222 start_codon:yes stop_codon:yes gene_type:complete
MLKVMKSIRQHFGRVSENVVRRHYRSNHSAAGVSIAKILILATRRKIAEAYHFVQQEKLLNGPCKAGAASISC